MYSSTFIFCVFLFIAAACGLLGAYQAIADDPISLESYHATYKTRFAGLSFTIKRSLSIDEEDGRCELVNEAAILFLGFAERAVFGCDKHSIRPMSYQYTNTINTKKNISIVYDWEKNRALTVKGDKHRVVPLQGMSFDQLSLQAQLRLDLMMEGDRFTQKTYDIVDARKVKRFTIKKVGEESIKTPAGTFKTIKLEEYQDPNKDKIIIWLAKDRNYFIVRLEELSGNGKVRTATLSELHAEF